MKYTKQEIMQMVEDAAATKAPIAKMLNSSACSLRMCSEGLKTLPLHQAS